MFYVNNYFEFLHNKEVTFSCKETAVTLNGSLQIFCRNVNCEGGVLFSFSSNLEMTMKQASCQYIHSTHVTTQGDEVRVGLLSASGDPVQSVRTLTLTPPLSAPIVYSVIFEQRSLTFVLNSY